MNIDLFDFFYNLIMEILEFGIIYLLFVAVYKWFNKERFFSIKSALFRTAIFGIIALIPSASTYITNYSLYGSFQISPYEVVAFIIFLIATFTTLSHSNFILDKIALHKQLKNCSLSELNSCDEIFVYKGKSYSFVDFLSCRANLYSSYPDKALSSVLGKRKYKTFKEPVDEIDYLAINAIIYQRKENLDFVDAVDYVIENKDQFFTSTKKSTLIFDNSANQQTNSVATEQIENSKPIDDENIMYCRNCGHKLTEDSNFCEKCGIAIKAEKTASDSNTASIATKERFKFKKALIIIPIILVLSISLVLATIYFFIPEFKYAKAVKLADSKNFEEANMIFEQLGDYRDSNLLIHHHSYYKIVDSLSPTCLDDGYVVKECSCGEAKKDILNAQHSYKPATCIEPKICSACGEKSGAPLGHTDAFAVCAWCDKILFEKQSFSGYGPGYVKNISLPIGKYSITGSHNGQHNFIVYFHGGKYNNMIANKIGKCSTVTTVRSSTTYPIENGYIDVHMADGSWTFTIEALVN